MDPVADAITIIRNGYLARKKIVRVSNSRLKEAVVQKIAALGFLEKVNLDDTKRTIEISLRYSAGEPVLHGIEKVSKPSLRIYTPKKKIPRVLGGYGEVLLSTPKGVLTGKEAKKANLGGEIILKVW